MPVFARDILGGGADTLGFLMASAGNLLMAYLSLEFVSLTSYVLTGFLRHDRRSGEAAPSSPSRNRLTASNLSA